MLAKSTIHVSRCIAEVITGIFPSMEDQAMKKLGRKSLVEEFEVILSDTSHPMYPDLVHIIGENVMKDPPPSLDNHMQDARKRRKLIERQAKKHVASLL